MLLRAKVDESNIAPVSVGQRSRVYVNAYPDEVFDGVVDFVDMNRELDRDGTGFIAADILLTLPGGRVLRTGLTANAEIEVEAFEGVLRVPSQCVLDRRIDELPKAVVDASPNVDKTKTFARVAYTVRDGKAVPVPVAVGSSDQTHTVILAGLAEGDRVVSGPYKVLVGLKHDQKVTEEGAATPPAQAAATDDAPAAKTGS
jgi:HlyD family secretion protein